MRIAILSDAILPYHQGGKETIHFERSTRLAQRGHTVDIYTMHWWPERARRIERDGVRLHAIMPRVKLYTRGGRRSIWQAVAFGLASIRLLWSEPFDVLDVDQFPFLHIFPARLVCRLRRRPMTLTWHEVWSRTYWRRYMGWLGPVGHWLQRQTVRRAGALFADSALTADRLATELGVPKERILYLPPCGIESLHRSRPAPEDLPAAFDCILVGRLLAHKHVDVLIRALATLPGVTCLALGSGPERARLEQLAGALGVRERITFDSVATPAEVLSRLRQARLFVLPSTREGFGIAVWEANACGLPALVVRHPDNAALELVEDGLNGFVCELDPVEIAATIRGYLADPQGQARMRDGARRRAASYSWERHTSRVEGALQALASPARRAA